MEAHDKDGARYSWGRVPRVISLEELRWKPLLLEASEISVMQDGFHILGHARQRNQFVFLMR